MRPPNQPDTSTPTAASPASANEPPACAGWSLRIMTFAAVIASAPLICTIYNGNFADAGYRKIVRSAVALFNDAIIRTGIDYKLTVIDLRSVCAKPEDYANPIEPSSVGAAKIARAITAVVTGSIEGKGAFLVGGS
jgi:hypothetical protein